MATDVLSRAQEPANGPGSGTAMSWVNTPMSSLLGISWSGEGGAARETLRWSSVCPQLGKMDFELKRMHQI